VCVGVRKRDSMRCVCLAVSNLVYSIVVLHWNVSVVSRIIKC